MGIIAWFRTKRLQRRKEDQARRLSEIRASLQKLNTQDIKMHLAIQSELARIRELKKQLNKVKSEDELRFWLSLFNMCAPVFEALMSFSKAPANVRRTKRHSKK